MRSCSARLAGLLRPSSAESATSRSQPQMPRDGTGAPHEELVKPQAVILPCLPLTLTRQTCSIMDAVELTLVRPRNGLVSITGSTQTAPARLSLTRLTVTAAGCAGPSTSTRKWVAHPSPGSRRTRACGSTTAGQRMARVRPCMEAATTGRAPPATPTVSKVRRHSMLSFISYVCYSLVMQSAAAPAQVVCHARPMCYFATPTITHHLLVWFLRFLASSCR